MPDPLAQFRRRPIEEKPSIGPVAPDEYVAFDARDKVARIKIRQAGKATHWPSYSTLVNVVMDEVGGTNFAMVFTTMMVVVRGKNLQDVATAIGTGNAEFIQQFDDERWQTPKNGKAPFIDSIQIFAVEDGPVIDGAQSPFDAFNKRKMH
jgi:hypothetical protein